MGAAWLVVLIVAAALIGAHYLGEWVAWVALAVLLLWLVGFVAGPADTPR